MKMQLLRRNNVNPIPGARHQTSAFHGDRGWKPRKSSPPPVEGELFSLTFPFIDRGRTIFLDIPFYRSLTFPFIDRGRTIFLDIPFYRPGDSAQNPVNEWD